MQTRYENYPAGIIFLSLSVSFLIYALGTFILARLGILFAFLYVLYCIGNEMNLLRSSCRHCYYFGKACAFGKGRLCALVFRKGTSDTFISRKITWRDMIPDLLVMLVPVAGGIAVLILRFSPVILLAIIALAVLSFAGNAFIRGNFACKYCKQAELGCPALDLFSPKIQ